MFVSFSFAYYYNSVNGISSGLDQSEPIKWRLLYVKPYQTIIENLNFKVEALNTIRIKKITFSSFTGITFFTNFSFIVTFSSMQIVFSFLLMLIDILQHLNKH